MRTHLQHSWATAIEAVGLFRGEELKNHQGSTDWLRLFKLMSAEFAVSEECPIPLGLPCDQRERLAELQHLQQTLDAVAVLEGISHGVRGTDFALAPGYKPTHYLIKFDHASKTVSVVPYNKAIAATKSYDEAEERDYQNEVESRNMVLVEVDKINNLRLAYPNYFGDVGIFRNWLSSVTLGKSLPDYATAPRQLRPPVMTEYGDPSWMRSSRFPRPRLKKKRR